MDRRRVLTKLAALKPELESQYKVKELSLFGSFVRGDQSQASDIDVLVDFGPEASLFDLVRLALFLQNRLGRKVDVIPRESLRAEIRDEVLRERILV